MEQPEATEEGNLPLVDGRHTHTDTYLGVTRYGASVPCIVGAYMLWCPVVWVQVVYP
jgi:hypothetical protein